MYPVLTNYINRFIKPENKPENQSNTQSQNLKFYTNYSLEEHYSQLPYLYAIENFCLRLYEAYTKGQKICIYSDYDTDAITATGTMYWGLLEFGFDKNKISYYAPDRFIEGYGINLEAIKKLSLENDLIISVDCGINSVVEAKFLLSQNCDLIITDHHLLVGDVPPAVAVCNPRLSDYYNQSPEKSPQINLELIKQFPETTSWLDKLTNTTTKTYMSHSVTGVGVAWFTLVWYQYFIQAVESLT